MSQFNSGKRCRRRPIGLQTEHRHAPALDRAMILLDDVVQVAARADFD
jgi:hypothetical protein